MESGDSFVEKRPWGCLSRRHIFFFLLVLGVVFFFYSEDIKEMTSPKQWLQNHSLKFFFPLRKQNKTFGSSIEPEPTAALHSVKWTMHDPSTDEPLSQNQTTASPEGTEKVQRNTVTQQQVLSAQTTVVPYVSPGPYLVEYPYKYHFILNEPQQCEQDKPFVVLIVQVAPRNRAHRDIIRSTWGGESQVEGKAVKLFFLLGRQTGTDREEVQQLLLQESKRHQDLIQSDFVDCYKNLTIKTMVMLEWVKSFCSRTSYVMKIDSDMFLNVRNLVLMLLNAPRADYMTGLVAQAGAVLRDRSSKWYLPEDLYRGSVYPPYALGLGYILSSDLTTKLIEASRHVRPVYIEDVYLGLCMKHLGIRPTNPPDFSFFHVHPLRYSRCAYSRIIATTTHDATDRMWLWKDFKRPGPYC